MQLLKKQMCWQICNQNRFYTENGAAYYVVPQSIQWIKLFLTARWNSQYSATIIMRPKPQQPNMPGNLKDNGLRQDTIDVDSMIMVDTLRSKKTSNLTLNPITKDIFVLVDHVKATLLIDIRNPIRSQTIQQSELFLWKTILVYTMLIIYQKGSKVLIDCLQPLSFQKMKSFSKKILYKIIHSSFPLTYTGINHEEN